MVTFAMADQAERQNMLSASQTGFRSKRSTAPQIEMMVMALEDAYWFKQDISNILHSECKGLACVSFRCGIGEFAVHLLYACSVVPPVTVGAGHAILLCRGGWCCTVLARALGV